MATYEQFLDALNRSNWAGEWSQSDLDLAKLHPEFGMSMLSYKDDWHNAATPEQRALANEGANEQRKLWGNYTGGADGRKFYSLGPQHLAADGLLEQAQEYEPFEYAREPEYRAALERVTGYDPFSYSREPDYQSALDSVLRYRDFSYDPETDPVYSAYRKTYAREGRRASEDTLGQYAAMTGGAPSTAAMTAAQQAGNYYSAQMADKIPELYQQAYQRYLQEYQRQLQALDAIDADRRFSYGMYGDDYSRRMQALDALDADRRFDYGVYGDDFNRLMSRYGAVRDQENTEYDRSRQEDETAYRRDQDTLDRVRQNMLDLYGMDQDRLDRERQAMLDRYGMEQDAYANRLNAAKLGMSVGDYSGLGDLGITPDWNAVLNAELASQGRTVPVGSSGSGGGSSGGTGGTGGSPAKDTAQTETPTYATIAEELAAQGSPPSLTQKDT